MGHNVIIEIWTVKAEFKAESLEKLRE